MRPEDIDRVARSASSPCASAFTPRWVDGGKMAPERADHELACMTAIVETLQKLVWLAEVSEEMRAQYRAEHGAAPEPNADTPELPL